MAQSAPSPPPLLLTKRITSFLARSLSNHIHTVLLCSPAGKLLAHVSSPFRPVAELRTQATVAASLISLYASSGSKLAPVLSRDSDVDNLDDAPSDSSSTNENGGYSYVTSPSHSRPHGYGYSNNGPRPALGSVPPLVLPAVASADTDMPHDLGERSSGPRPKTITVQLAGGAVIVRELACGLLFVCVGTAAPSPCVEDATHAALSSLSLHGQAAGSAGPPVATTLAQQPASAGPRNPPGSGSGAGSTAHSHTASNNHNGAGQNHVASGGSSSGGAPNGASTTPTGPVLGSTAATGPPSGSATCSTGSGLLLAGGLGGMHLTDSPDEADSVLSAGGMTTASVASTASAVAVAGMKRVAEEAARRLDAKLAALCVPDEGVFE
ncbi:hypothetical protein Cpir12675_006067 [Ceratocystis pirilliformis]|uniref:Roadblock/LAMTOR2 domain-containing protein n=1 Tax=Ceratocystis pirilliformis TaxID=259994 RepID=A0ABR3YLF4_9PEZI